jgi:hypothetical protein
MPITGTPLAAALLGCSAAAHAMTVIIYVDPMTLDHYTKVIQTPGPDRAMMCMAPPAVADCREISFRRG